MPRPALRLGGYTYNATSDTPIVDGPLAGGDEHRLAFDGSALA